MDGEANGNPLQYSCLVNPMEGGARRARVHGIATQGCLRRGVRASGPSQERTGESGALGLWPHPRGSSRISSCEREMLASSTKARRRQWHPTPVLLPGKSHGQRSLVGCSLPDSLVHGDSPGKNIGVGCHALRQGIFPIQGLNPGLLRCREILYCLSHQGITRITPPIPI